MTSLISDSLNGAICEQVAHEIFNSNLYLYISAFLKNKGLDNISKHFEGQWKEEQGHAKMFVDFLTDMNSDVKIPEVPACETAFDNILDIANLYLQREILTTESIDSIKHLAIDENNPVTEEFLRGMITLQQNEYEESTSFLDMATLLPEWWQVAMWNNSLGD